MIIKSKSLAVTYLIFCFVSLSIPAGTPAATSPAVTLTLYKRFGFAAFSDMTGAFTAIASVSPDVVRVEFYLDNQLMLNDTAAPFHWEFDTSNYTLGPHHFEVIAYNNASESAHASIEANFVEGPFPLYYGIILAFLLVVLPILALILRPKSRKERYREGAVCQ